MDAANTPYHAVSELARRLTAAGFRAFREQDAWQLEPGTRGFVVRAGGSIVAFEVGSKPPADAGFVLIGAHSDSPNLRLKPLPDLTSVGYRQLSVEVYGGVLLSTWLDRDLSVAGRVVLADGHAELIDLKRVVCRIPNLAIHLNRDVNSAGLLLNAQTHLLPVLGLESQTVASPNCWRRDWPIPPEAAPESRTCSASTCACTTRSARHSPAARTNSCSRVGSTIWPRATPRCARCSVPRRTPKPRA